MIIGEKIGSAVHAPQPHVAAEPKMYLVLPLRKLHVHRSGLTPLEDDERNPLATSSYGMGDLPY